MGIFFIDMVRATRTGAEEFEVFQTSQAVGSLNNLSKYDFILIDIDLSVNSQLDGFQLIEEILKLPDLNEKKIIILTGQPTIKEKLKEKKLPLFPIIQKPIIYNQIEKAFTEAKRSSEYTHPSN